jgi:signal transduction histidine kinase
MGARSWGDALLGRAWVLVAAVALLVAMPILVLGQLAENETRARLQAAQLESATRTAAILASGFNERLQLIGSTLLTLAQVPQPASSPIGLAVQRNDVAALQALTDLVQRQYVHDVLRAYIAVRGTVDTIDEAPIVAASPAGTGLIGRRLSDLPSHPALPPGCNSVDRACQEDVYEGSADAPSVATVTALVPPPGRSPQQAANLASAQIAAVLDFARTFAETSAPSLGVTDDAYILDGKDRLAGRARGTTPLPLRDLSGDPFVRQVDPSSGAVARIGAEDPLGSGTRLLASAPVAGSGWLVLLVRDTSAIDREIDAVLGQLALARYLLVALLLIGAFLMARAAEAQLRQRRALADANRQIEAASLHKSAFLSNMSHELRTPLNSINGFSDVLLTDLAGPLNAKQREYLGDIRASGEHLLALVNDILDLSKVEAGRMDLDPRDFDLREALASLHRVVAPLADQKRQTLTLAADAAGIVHLDEGRVRQAVLNVLSNAVKYTPDGGSITTTVARRDGRVEIAVSDTGVGIGPQDQARIFDDFTRVESGYARTQQGTGLGLALSRRLVRLMGGDITLASEPGRGSTFTISVPTRQIAGKT